MLVRWEADSNGQVVNASDGMSGVESIVNGWNREWFPKIPEEWNLRRMDWRAFGAMSVLSLGLVGCGGGGGGGTTTGTTPQPPQAASPCDGGVAVATVQSSGALVGKQAAVGILGCTAAITDVQWTQTSGPAVDLLSAQTQVIHFEPGVAGTYGFRASYHDALGRAGSIDVSSAITAPATPALAIVRNHQAVRMGGNVSVRAWSGSGDAVQSVSWVQLDGPKVALQPVDNLARQFVAPAVTQDSVLHLRATVTAASGTDSQDVLILVEKYDQASDNDDGHVWAGSHVSRVHAYLPSGPYAGLLAPCVYDAKLTAATVCTLGQLPLLGQETAGALPSVEQVMKHVVVSHDWLGANFEAFLRTNDLQGDFRRMLMSTTAIVLGAHVRPSFYDPATGAIYLDGDNFWLTPAERDTIDEVPDYRSDFGSSLAYANLWRYAKAGDRFFKYWDPQLRITRTQSDLLAEAGWLLYHELSHAGDFIPPAQYAALGTGDTVNAFVGGRYRRGELVSDSLHNHFPLTSVEMQGLEQVESFGSAATPAQKRYTVDQVVGFFTPDLATDPYAYSDSREDLAMTLEETLMSLRLGVQRDIAFVPNDASGADFDDVRWGQRGRIGDPRLRGRIKLVAAEVAPWLASDAPDALPAPVAMRVGDSWDANLTLASTVPPSRHALSVSADMGRWIDEQHALKRWADRARDRREAHDRVDRWLKR